MHVAEGRCLLVRRGESQSSGRKRPFEQLVETWLVEGGVAGVEQRNLVDVDVKAENVVPDVGHCSSMNGAEITATNDGDIARVGSCRSGRGRIDGHISRLGESR